MPESDYTYGWGLAHDNTHRASSYMVKSSVPVLGMAAFSHNYHTGDQSHNELSYYPF